jgi:hypothetical protein
MRPWLWLRLRNVQVTPTPEQPAGPDHACADTSSTQAATPPDNSPATPPPNRAVADLLAQRQQFLRFLSQRVQSPALAEDILQNAYLRAIEHAGELRQHESSTAWFYRMLRNAVIDFYRHRSVEDRALEGWAATLETEVPADDLTRDIVCQCIAGVLPSLNPN